jgi:hypothetical protein
VLLLRRTKTASRIKEPNMKMILEAISLTTFLAAVSLWAFELA